MPTPTPIRNTPRARAEMVARLQDFHHRAAQQNGPEPLLSAYARAVCSWAADPNTDLYHVERLFDEIHHAAPSDAPDDDEDNVVLLPQPSISSLTGPPTG